MLIFVGPGPLALAPGRPREGQVSGQRSDVADHRPKATRWLIDARKDCIGTGA